MLEQSNFLEENDMPTLMREILGRLKDLGPDWAEKLADEMTEEERAAVSKALKLTEPAPPPSGDPLLG
jgi:hypothetical protein